MNIFNISDDEFIRNQREMFYDRKYDAALEAAAAGEDLEETELGMTGGLATDDLGLGVDEPTDEPTPEGDLPEEPGGDDAPEEVETALLEPPAKRDDYYNDADWYKLKKKKDGSTTTSKSKGKWYIPTKSDNRKTAARHKSYLAQVNGESGKATRRNTHKGFQDLLGLGRGTYENKDTNYTSEEKKLFEVNNEVKNLITEMESRDNETKTQ